MTTMTVARRQARRAAWLRGERSYLDLYAILVLPETEDVEKVRRCQHTWVQESRGQQSRWRAIGCSIRSVCPVCGAYRQSVLAREASETMLLAMVGVEIGGVQLGGVSLDSYGLKLVFTIPKTESARIDTMLYSGNYDAWRYETGRLFKAAYESVGRWFGPGCGGVASLDYTGESSPADAHYHVNVYVFPARKTDAGWSALPRWFDSDKLAAMRSDWTDTVNSMYCLQLESANVTVDYLGGKGQLNHWTRYLYRHSLSDLWRGWQGRDGETVKYRYKSYGLWVDSSLSGDELSRIAERLMSIPAHFKRIRWFGIFSDGQRGKTMSGLGLEPVEIDDDDDGDGDAGKWVADGPRARFVRFVPDGVILREFQRDAAGDVLRDSLGDILLGPEFLVPDAMVEYRPSKVAIGKRKRWREPGGKT